MLNVSAISIPPNGGTVTVTLSPAQIPFIIDSQISDEPVLIETFPSDDTASPEATGEGKVEVEVLKDPLENYVPSNTGSGQGGVLKFTNISTITGDYMSGAAIYSVKGS